MRVFKEKDIDEKNLHINSCGEFSYINRIAYYRIYSFRKMWMSWRGKFIKSDWDYNTVGSISIRSVYAEKIHLYTIGKK